MSIKHLACLLAVTTLSAACTTTIKVQNLGSQKTPHVTGLPFRTLEPYTVRVYAKDANNKYEEVFVKWLELANPDQLYSINYESQYFANSAFELGVRDDNSLVSLNASGESTLPQAIKDIGKQSADLATAAAGYENQRRAAQKETLESETSLLKAKAAVLEAEEAPSKDREARIEAALKAINDVQAAQRELESLPEKATLKDRAAAEAALRLAQLRANQASRRAGLTELFPGVFP